MTRTASAQGRLRTTTIVGLAAGLLALVTLIAIAVVPSTASAQGGEPPPQCVDEQDQDADGTADDFDQEGGPLYCDTNGAVVGPTAGSPPNGGGPPGGGSGGEPCEGASEGPVTISNVMAKRPGQPNWQPFEGQCMLQPYEATMGTSVISFTDPSNQSFPQDLSNLYPEGSEISFDLAASGVTPVFVLGTGSEMKAGQTSQASRALGNPMTVQGTVPRLQFGTFSPGGEVDCASAPEVDFYGVVLQFRVGGQFGDLMSTWNGFVMGTNATVMSFDPEATSTDGNFGISVEGCGDLYLEMTLPEGGLAGGGLTASLAKTLAAELGDDVPDQLDLNELEVDQPVPPNQYDAEFVSPEDVSPEPIPGLRGQRVPRAARKDVAGVQIDYRNGSPGAHDVRTATNRKAIKKAKKAVKKCKRKGKLKVKKGKIACKRKKKGKK